MPSDPVLVVVALLGWCAVVVTARALTRFGRPAAGPEASEPPDDLPPGVVGYLVSGPDTGPAAAATLLDLAARGVLVVDPGAGRTDGRAVVPTVRPAEHAGHAEGLSRLESLVVARVTGLGHGGPVPLPALAGRAGAPGDDDVTAAVVADTRALGLTRPRAGVVLRTVLVVAAALSSWVVGDVVVSAQPDAVDPTESRLAVAAVTLCALLLPVWGRFGGERLTRAGRRAAAGWLGHARQLGRDELLRAAGPADLAVQGRRVAYARALGLTRGLERLVRFGPGDRSRVWSGFGGRWRQVEVRYPGGLFAGRPAGETALLGVWLVAVSLACVAMLFWVPAAAGWSPGGPWLTLLRTAGVVLVLGLAARVVLRLVGGALEPGSEREVVGEVLWIEEHHVDIDDDDTRHPKTYHLVVDEGTDDRTTAWSLPVGLRDRCDAGDVVRLTARPWSRTVVSVERTPAGRPQT